MLATSPIMSASQGDIPYSGTLFLQQTGRNIAKTIEISSI